MRTMKRFIFFFAILLGIAATCGANSVQAAASSSLGMKDHTSLQVTSSSPKDNLRQSAGHESLDSSSSNNHHLYRQLEYLDFNTDQLGAAEVGFLVGILVVVVLILLLLCCCCGCGGRGGGCSVCDILAAICIWEMCCDQGDPTDFCLV
jgi:hypothetical protein